MTLLKVYYPVRHHLVHHMVNSIQRLGFMPTATLDHKKLAVELAEVIIKWELHGVKEEFDPSPSLTETSSISTSGSIKRANIDDSLESHRKKIGLVQIQGQSPWPVASPSSSSSSQSTLPKVESDISRPIEKVHTDMVLNCLLRLACQVNDSAPQTPTNPPTSSSGELLSRRCVLLLKTSLKPDVWPQPIDLALTFFDKILQNIESPNANYGNICTVLELLTFILTVLRKDQILAHFKPLQRRLAICLTSQNNRVIRLVVYFTKS